jgi:DNA-binding MurR/RpiR family transcriptional regulator
MEMTEGLLPQSVQIEATCTARISTLYPHFTKADRAAADLIINHPETAVRLSSRELGRQCGISEASVIRFVQKLGYEGLIEFREALRQELMTSQTPVGADFSPEDTPAEVMSKVVALCSQALQNLVAVLDVNELARAAEAISAADCLHFFSAGGSMRVAQHAAFKLMRMGYLSMAVCDPIAQMAQASLTGAKAVAIGLSFTGSSKAVVDALAVARDSGATTICLTNFAGTPITQVSDIKLITGAPGGLLAANSAPARVAQFAVLDAVCALIAPREGGREAAAA